MCTFTSPYAVSVSWPSWIARVSNRHPVISNPSRRLPQFRGNLPSSSPQLVDGFLARPGQLPQGGLPLRVVAGGKLTGGAGRARRIAAGARGQPGEVHLHVVVACVVP